MKRLLGVLAVLMIFISGCATSNICENIPEGQISVICEATDFIHVSPENLSKILLITNIAALEADKYTALEAMAFVNDAEAKLIAVKGKNTLTYGDVVNYLINEHAGLSPRLQAVFTIVDPLSSLIYMEEQLPTILSDFDIDLLLLHLAKQKTIIMLYL